MSYLSNLIFKNQPHYVTSPFGKRTVITTSAGRTASYHEGVDYGTNGKKIPQYAIEDGYVFAAAKASDGALYVWVVYPGIKKAMLHYHLDSYAVKAGTKVVRGTKLGVTGTTGKSTGVHLHLGVRDLSKLTDARIKAMTWDALRSCSYVDAEGLNYGLAKPVKRDAKRDQIEVTSDTLNIREKPTTSANSIGHAAVGYYNILATATADNYKWYKIADDQWVAAVPGAIKFYEYKPQNYDGTFPSLLLYSDVHVQIERWQKFLKWYGKAVSITGKYDAATIKATKEFQTEQSNKNGNGKITANGYCNAVTVKAAKAVKR